MRTTATGSRYATKYDVRQASQRDSVLRVPSLSPEVYWLDCDECAVMCVLYSYFPRILFSEVGAGVHSAVAPGTFFWRPTLAPGTIL